MACNFSCGAVRKTIGDEAWWFLALESSRDGADFSSRVKLNGIGESRRLSAAARLNRDLFAPLVVRRRNGSRALAGNRLSSSGPVAGGGVDREEDGSSHRIGSPTLDAGSGKIFPTVKNDQHRVSVDVECELLFLCVPAIAAQAMLLLGHLLETASIGELGALDLASAGVSINIFNYVSKFFNVPLQSVATSFVAEDISKHATTDPLLKDSLEDCTNGKPVSQLTERKQLSSVSTALILAVGVGLFEALIFHFGSGILLNLMSISPDSSLRIPARQFLSLRAVGAPAVVLYSTLQAVFRGFKDTKTSVLCLGIGNLWAVCLSPLLIYYFQLGATGAAISIVVSQYVTASLMIWFLNKKVVLLSPKFGAVPFGEYMKSGGFLLGRTLSVRTTMTVGTSMVARQGAVAMAAHQICIQVWLVVSILIDALATSSQVMIARAVSKGDYKTAKKVTVLALKIGLLTGVVLFSILGASFRSLAPLFTKDAHILEIVRAGVLFVSATQPLISLAFLFDGLHYGVSDFPYAACSMVVVGAISSTIMLYAPSSFGLYGPWLGLTLFMGLRTAAGFARLLSKNGPWWFLHSNFPHSNFPVGTYAEF